VSNKFFVSNEDVDRIELEDGQWVDIKSRMSYGDHQYIVSRYIDIQGQLGAPGSTMTKYEIAQGNLALLERSIVAWSFVDDGDKPVPVNKDTISKLRVDIANMIADEVNKHNPLRGV
jgi:hypothetical protein